MVSIGSDQARVCRTGPRPGRAVPLLPAPVGLAEGELLVAACRAVGAAQGIEVTSPRLDGVDDPLRLIARASGFRTRRVKLPASWWSQEGTPMLGRRADDGRPVALIPDPRRRYLLVDPAAQHPSPR